MGIILPLLLAFNLPLFAGCSTILISAAPSQEQANPQPQEEELAATIAASFARIPDPRKLRRADLEATFQLVDGISAACRDYLTRFPEGKNAALVNVTLARVMLLNSERYIATEDQKQKNQTGEGLSDEKKQSLREQYLLKVDGIAATAYGDGHPAEVRSKAAIVRAELHLRLLRADESCEFYQKALELNPNARNSDETSIKLIEALERANRYEEMSRLGEETLAKWPRSRFLPHLLFFIHKSYRHLGMLRKGRDFWLHWGPILERGARGEPLDLPGGDDPWLPDVTTRPDFKVFADRAGFYVSFYQLALGEQGDSLAGLLTYIDQLQSRRIAGETLSMTTKVYLEMQAEPMARRIDHLHGEEAPSLEGADWIQPPPEDDPDRRVELRIFCDGRRAGGRQEAFFEVLGRLSAEMRDEGLRVTWIAHSRNEAQAEKEVRRIFRLSQKYGQKWTIGMEVGTTASILDRHLVSQGGVVLFAIDSRNRIAWEMIDPMYWDEGLYRQVVTRLLAESNR
ncbi:MAG TPA: hypothetical protein EYN79_02470 [Planctomycetes bacterium]|nr:hypothetical protein [Planctomycetota bacterium]HIN79729.1 hypothetical protein [Planctomycetota bacterium]